MMADILLHIPLMIFTICAGWYLTQWLSLIVHELGHFLAARWMGFPVMEVQLGTGRRWGTIHLGGVPWHIHSAPMRGWVAPKEDDFLDSRGRGSVFVLAGPVATILLALSVHFWFAIDYKEPVKCIYPILNALEDHGFRSSVWGFVGIGLSLVVVNAWGSLWLTALCCLFPYRSEDRTFENDGFLLLKIFCDRYRDPRDLADFWKNPPPV